MLRAEKKPVGGAIAAPTVGGAIAPTAAGRGRQVQVKRRSNSASHQITVQRVSRARHVPSDAQFRRWVNAALAGRVDGNCELTLRVVGPAEMQTLNREYRDKDYATNVLSFPFDAPADIALPVQLLGDIVLCAQTVQREAKEQGKPVAAHWAHLAVHGVLHLLGMDHLHVREAKKMEDAEIALLATLGIANPYLVTARLATTNKKA